MRATEATLNLGNFDVQLEPFGISLSFSFAWSMAADGGGTLDVTQLIQAATDAARAAADAAAALREVQASHTLV